MNTFRSSIEQQLSQPSLSRRHVLGKALGVGAAALAVGIAGTIGTQAATVTQYKTTARVNLRSGPGTTYGIITVIPAGTIVAHTGKIVNRFYEVGAGHTYGWIHGDYLTRLSSDPVEIGTRVAKTRLNLRSGPSTSHQILDIVDQGATVTITDKVQNGYRYVIQHTGPAGWVIDSGLGSGSGSPTGETFTTTANLNLRAEPSTSAKVLLVMPSGATVKALSGTASGWRQVSYNGTVGWAATAYLN